jgi:tetratricopeptide (TPR) repeat protein
VRPAPGPSDSLDAHLAHARALADAGYTRAAVEIVAVLLERDPEHVESLRLKARLHETLGEERAAIALYERLAGRASGDLDAVFRSGAARLRIGDLEEALPRLRRYAAEVPGDPSGRRTLAAALYRKALDGGGGDAPLLGEAEGELRAARDLRPEDADIHHDLASLLVVRGDAAGAEVEYRAALEWNPDHLGALEGLAELLEGQGRRAEARALAARALRLERHPMRQRTLERLLREGGG